MYCKPSIYRPPLQHTKLPTTIRNLRHFQHFQIRHILLHLLLLHQKSQQPAHKPQKLYACPQSVVRDRLNDNLLHGILHLHLDIKRLTGGEQAVQELPVLVI